MDIEQNRLKAALIRKCRIEQNWKQEAFAKSLPLASSSFSEMERGLRPIPEDLFVKMCNKLQIQESTDNFIESIQNQLLTVKKNLYMCKYDEACFRLSKLNDDKDRINKSILFLEYNLTQFICNVTCNNNYDKYLSLITEYYDCLDILQKYQFVLYKGIAEKSKHNPKAAIKLFSNLLNQPYQIQYFSELLYYHAAICYIHIGHLALAHNLNKKAETLFQNEQNINRLAFTMMHEAIIYSQENQIDEAEKIYKKLLDSYSKYLPDQIVNTILCNAGYNFVKANLFYKAIDIYSKLKPNWQQIPQIFYGIAWTLLQTDQENELNKFLQYSRKYPKDKFIDDMLEVKRK